MYHAMPEALSQDATVCHDSGSWLSGSSSALLQHHACLSGQCMALGLLARRLRELSVVEVALQDVVARRSWLAHMRMCGYAWLTWFQIVVQTASQEVRRNMASFKEVRNNMSEGLRFYMSLQEAIAVLAQQAGDYILTRRLQRWGPTLSHPHDMYISWTLPTVLQHARDLILAGCHARHLRVQQTCAFLMTHYRRCWWLGGKLGQCNFSSPPMGVRRHVVCPAGMICSRTSAGAQAQVATRARAAGLRRTCPSSAWASSRPGSWALHPRPTHPAR